MAPNIRLGGVVQSIEYNLTRFNPERCMKSFAMVAAQDTDVAAVLAGRLSGNAQVCKKGSPEFEKSNLRFTEYERPTYTVAVVPACEQDVVETVKACRELNVPFAARSGHHAVTTTMRHLKDGVLIDMTRLNALVLNEDKTKATVGGGTITDDFVAFLQQHHREVTVGSCPTTGIIGVCLGAGLGRLQGVYGYLHDNLVSCRIVLADGSVVEASADSHPDLFWAIRGAGHNFGIVLQATFSVHPERNGGLHYSWDLEYPLEKCEEVIRTLNEVHSTMPPDLAIFLLWHREAAGGHKNLILVNLVWSGGEAEADPWVQRFESLGPLLNGGKVTTTWRDLPWETYGGQNKILSKPGVWSIRPWKMMTSVSVKSFDVDTTRAFFESVKEMNDRWKGRGVFGAMFECLPTHRVRQVPDDHTAFPWRWGSDHFLMMTATPFSLDDREEFEAHLDHWKSRFVQVSGYGRLQQYVNYGNTTSTCRDAPEALYGYEPWRLEKLRSLKSKYDPDNVFRYYQPLLEGTE